MEKKNLLTKALAYTGSALVWFPILFPVLFSLVAALSGRGFHLDFLMPAEFFPAVLIGGALLVWAAIRIRSHRALTGWGLGIAAVSLVAGQALAVANGLASGETAPVGINWALVIASLVIYVLAAIVLGIGGILLLLDLYRARQVPA